MDEELSSRKKQRESKRKWLATLGGDKDEAVRDATFHKLSDKEQIAYTRKTLGMEPLGERAVACKRCGKGFTSQVIGMKQMNHYCTSCKSRLHQWTDMLEGSMPREQEKNECLGE